MAKINSGITLDVKLNTEDLIKELKQVQREAKKATQAVKEYESIKEQKADIDQLLHLADKYNFILTGTNEKSRGIGKTSALINKANKEKLLIIVGHLQMSDYIKPGLEPDILCATPEILFKQRGYNFKKFNGFITDDGVSNRLINQIKDFTGLEFKGGFNNLPISVR